MDLGHRAVLTAAVVAAVLMAARLFGRRVAGLLAGLPVITAPALLWLAQAEGAAFAAASATGSLAACGGAALFALAFERIAHRRGGWPVAFAALSVALGVFAAAALALGLLARWPGLVLAVVLGVCAAVPVALRSRRRAVAGAAAGAAAVSAGVTAAAQTLGPYGAGLVSTLPLISAVALLHLRLAGCGGDAAGFVAGYVQGLAAKALFVFVFGWVLPGVGALPAFALALAAGAGGALVLARLRRALPPTGLTDAPDPARIEPRRPRPA